MPASLAYNPFTDDQLQALYERFSVVDYYAPAPKPRPKWAKGEAVTDPPFMLVFRAALGHEWQGWQKAHEKAQYAGARALALMTIVAVSIDGVQIIHAGLDNPEIAANDSKASQGPRDALRKILDTPGFAGTAEDVADALARINNLHGSESEKG